MKKILIPILYGWFGYSLTEFNRSFETYKLNGFYLLSGVICLVIGSLLLESLSPSKERSKR